MAKQVEKVEFESMVDPQLIDKVEAVGADEADAHLETLAEVEPHLVEWVHEQAARLRRCYARQDAESEFCQVMEMELRWLLWGAIEIMRRAHHRIWIDSLTPQQLAANMKLDAKTRKRLKGRE